MNKIRGERGLILFVVALLLLPLGAAANDPGHDVLYIEQLGDSLLTGNLNISDEFRVSNLFYSTNLHIIGNGTIFNAPSQPRIMGGASQLYIDSTGNLYLNTKGGTSGIIQVGPTATNAITLNVSGIIYEQGTRVCLANGTNCVGGNNTGNVSSVTAGNGISVSPTTGDVVVSTSAATCGASEYSYWSGTAWLCRTDQNSGGTGDVTDVLAGTAITVTDSAGPQPSVAVTADAIDGAQLADTITLDSDLAITSGSINIDSETLFVNSTTNRIGLGTNAPSSEITIIASSADIKLGPDEGSGSEYLQLYYNSAGRAWGGLYAVDGGTSNRPIQIGGRNISLSTSPTGNVQNGEPSNTRLYVDASGNVGIGDVTPTGTLDVTGNIAISDTEVISSGRVGSFATGTTVNSQNICLADGTNCPAGTTVNVGLTNTSGNGNISMTQPTANVSLNSIYVDNTNGRLGLGTTAPETDLHINSTPGTNSGFYISDGDLAHSYSKLPASVYGGIAPFSSTEGGLWILGTTSGVSNEPIIIEAGTGSAHPILVKKTGADGSSAPGLNHDVFEIQSGTTAVMTMGGGGKTIYSISGVASGSDGALEVRSTVTNVDSTDVALFRGTNSAFVGDVIGLEQSRTASSAFDFIDATSDHDGTPQTEFRVRGDGVVYVRDRIGIGTTAPTTDLDVNGTINATAIKIGSNNVCQSDGTNCPAPGSGNVTGSGPSTDNAIARWNGAGGGSIQNSAVTISDAGAIAGVATLDTGQGAYELYAMDQDVQTSDSPSFAGLTISGTGDITMPQKFYIGSGANIAADGISALALGTNANASAPYSIAIGWTALASGNERTVAIGPSASTTGGNGAVAIGWSANAGYGDVAIGKQATATSGGHSVAIGNGAQALTLAAIGIGAASNASGTDSISIGPNSDARTTNSVAIGENANAAHQEAIALGFNAATTTANQFMVGSSSDNLNTYVHGTLTTTGNVGIGTTNPQGKLHILESGTAGTPAALSRQVGHFQQSGTAGSSASISIIAGNTGNSSIDFGDTGVSDAGRIIYDHNTNYMSFRTNQVFNRMVIDNIGNVGIGTPSPNNKLEVVGTVNGTNVKIGSTELCRADGTNCPAGASAPSTGWTNQSGGGNIQMTNTTVNVSANTLFVDNKNGRVGVGTSSPGQEIEIEDGADSNTNAALRLTTTSTSWDWTADSSNGFITLNLVGGGALNPVISADDATGNVGINTTTPSQALHVVGSLNVSGRGNIYYEGNLTGYGADLAEYVNGVGLEAGDVVVLAPVGKNAVEKSTQPYDTMAAGIISTNPSSIMGAGEGNELLALAGRVPVKVTKENGSIKRGDLLTTSSTPGHAMKCTDKLACVGAIVGKAMEDFDGDQGKITALVVLA